MKPWHLGNTTVRSPFRLRDGLVALSKSSLQGNLRGRDAEIAFGQLLAESDVVTLRGDITYSLGRKWRSALNKLGFLYPESKGNAFLQRDLGTLDAITENGWRLIEAETVSGWQECFLRSLAAYFIPSIVEQRYECPVFSPLRHTLKIMLELEKQLDESRVSFLEMALIVQCSSSDTNIQDIVKKIKKFRERRSKAKRKSVFYRRLLFNAAKKYNLAPGTFKDYADTNFRYLKATGLVQSKGKGITLVQEKRVFIEQLVADTELPESDLAYLKTICSGATLPTDKKESAISVLNDLLIQLQKRNEIYDLSNKNLDTPADIAIARHEIEERLSELNELDYSARQANFASEISEYMDLLIRDKRSKKLSNGVTIEIPKSEAPAYFEWIIWRTFLAINSLENKPWEARRFKIDQDFLPVHTAPGNGPDMVFEFDDIVLVVEVTLTTSSRQEAAEGESVRRHVAKYAEDFSGRGKQVFGLFLAVKIDTNTANTFRLGEWYLRDDRKIDLHIVPMALADFKCLIDAVKSDVSLVLPILKNLLTRCRMHVTKDAPLWKAKISELSNEAVLRFRT